MPTVNKERPKTRVELQKQIDEMAERCVSMRTDRDRIAIRVTQAENETKETHANFEDLKRRLHDAEVENARLRGYTDRVHEDDVVRDGFIEIEDERGKRQVPKRKVPHPLMQSTHDEDLMLNRHGLRDRKTHWTSY